MARCMGRTRSGRRCRRESQKGSTRCSIHMPKLVMGTSKSSSSSSSPRRGTSYPGSLNRTNERSGSRGQKTSTVVNPAFYQISMDNPLAQHFISDKVGDLSRSANVGVAMNAATMPMLYGGGPGLAAKVVTSVVGTILVSGYLNTVDQYRDLAHFATTGKIHGYSLMGETHH